MPHLPHALTMLAAGIGIPILAALNAQLGVRVGSPAAAACVLFLIAFACATATTLVTGTSALSQLPKQPSHLFFAGVLIAFYVLSITYVAPRFGVGNAVFFVLLGQLISTAAIDHFGLFGAQVKPLNLQRSLGLATMALGVVLAVRA